MVRKIIPFQIPKSQKEFVRFQMDEGKHFYDKLHQHPQWQLTLIIEGNGQLLVGDYLGRFEPGDLYLITSNLPHVLRSDPDYYEEETHLRSCAYTLFFDFDALGAQFWESEEMKPLNQWLLNTRGSFKLEGSSKEKIEGIIKASLFKEGTKKFLMGLQALEILEQTQDLNSLNKNFIQKVLSENEGKRMGRVMSFILSNSQQTLSLKEIANEANMSKEAFCRFFKERTGKTFTEFLTDVRIQQSCQQLLESDASIAQIAYQCGFQNLSYFNRVFKHNIKMSPSTFRKTLRKA